MGENYNRAKKALRKSRKANFTTIITLVVVIVIIAMTSAYSLWSSELKVEGTIESVKEATITKPGWKDPDAIPEIPGEDEAEKSQFPGEYEITQDGIVMYVMKDADGDGELDTPNWNDIDTMKTTYDQFVWIPVEYAKTIDMDNDNDVDDTDINLMIQEKKYPMAITRDNTVDGTSYKAVLYEFTEGENEVEISKMAWSDSSFNEPRFLITNDKNAGYNNVGITPSSIQEEFNLMVKKVSESKGFWVGRYETTNMSGDNTKDTTNKVKLTRGTTDGISNVQWYRMYAQQKSYSKLALGSSTTVTSSMIWGSQWDQMLIWMRKIASKYTDTTYTGKYFVTNSVGYGNYGSISGTETYDTAASTSEPAVTGYSDNFKIKNLFDIAGNVRDWTLEASGTISRVPRGGFYDDTFSSNPQAAYRNSFIPNYSFTYGGSRPSLY